jgi:hypothetical protein
MGLVYACANKVMDGSWAAGLLAYQQRSELVERGLHGLCEGAARVETIKHDNVGGYLWGWIHGAMVRPDTPLVKNMPRGLQVWPILESETASTKLDPRRIFWDVEDAADTLTLILWCCENAVDLQIVKQRLHGLTIWAVARGLAITPQTVRKKLLRIETEFYRIRRRGMSYQV